MPFLLKAAFITTSLTYLSTTSRTQTPYDPVCGLIANAVSSASPVAYPGDVQYNTDIYHFTSSSSQPAACTVEPGTAADIGIVLTILGNERTPFAVKNGGQTPQPGFSSSPGVLIAMSRFSNLEYDSASQTAVVGAGMTWVQVYDALAPHGVSVVGGRFPDVGVAGLVLSAGFSWKTSEYGLATDNVLAFELVKPDGTAVSVTAESDPELFFGLKGGLNNFGIVTSFTLRTFPQDLVWGGAIFYSSLQIPQLSSAMLGFSKSINDAKAGVFFRNTFINDSLIPALFLFYDAPTPPPGTFDLFLNIAQTAQIVKTQTYSSFVRSLGADVAGKRLRGVSDTVALPGYTPNLMNAILNETAFWATTLGSKLASGRVSHSPDLYLSSYLSHNPDPSAYPVDRTYGFSPFLIRFNWEDPAHDAEFHSAVKQSAEQIRQVALREGLVLGEKSPGAAAYDTSLEDIYGGNLQRLKVLKQRVDPNNVMGLCGGFKL